MVRCRLRRSTSFAPSGSLQAVCGRCCIGRAVRRGAVELERQRDTGLAADMQFTFRNPARSTDPDRTLREQPH